MQRIIILAGSPGSGKTTVSAALEKQGFVHLAIDNFYRQAPRDKTIEDWFKDEVYLDAAYAAFRQAVMERIKKEQSIVVETAGSGKRWKAFFDELTARYSEHLMTIYLQTPFEVAQQRLHERNKDTDQFNIDETRLKMFFESGKYIPSGYQYVINASRSLNEVTTEIISLLQ